MSDQFYGTTVSTRAEKISPPRPIPMSPQALAELAAAATVYAEAAGRFIAARDDLNEAKDRWQTAGNAVAKAMESEGI